MFHACAVFWFSCSCVARLPFWNAVMVNMLESWNTMTEHVMALSSLSTPPVAPWIRQVASAGVLCVFLSVWANGSGRVAAAQQTHNCEVRAQQGAVRCCLDDILSSSAADGSEAPKVPQTRLVRRDLRKCLNPRRHRRRKRRHRTRTHQPARQKKSPRCACACPGSKGSVSPLSGHDTDMRKDDTSVCPPLELEKRESGLPGDMTSPATTGKPGEHMAGH